MVRIMRKIFMALARGVVSQDTQSINPTGKTSRVNPRGLNFLLEQGQFAFSKTRLRVREDFSHSYPRERHSVLM